MKAKHFALFLVCATAMTHAFADGAYEENRLDTLHYRVPKNHFNPSAQLSTHLHDFTTVTQAGQVTSTSALSNVSGGVGVAYGITDDFLVTLQENYVFKENTSHMPVGGAVSTTQSSGLSNPELHANYRYYGGLKGTMFASASFNITPNLGNAVIAEPTQNGNNLAGATSASLGTTGYLVFADVHEFSLNVAGIYTDSGSFFAQDSTNSYSLSSYWKFTLGGNYRLHFLDNFYASASAAVTFGFTNTYDYANRTPALTQDASRPGRRLAVVGNRMAGASERGLLCDLHA